MLQDDAAAEELAIEDNPKKEPVFLIIADCILDDIANPLTGEPIGKGDLGFIIVITDFAVVIFTMLFITWIETSQKAFTKQYKDSVIDMADFTIRVKKIPHQKQYNDSDDILRGLLIEHFENIIKDKMKEEMDEGEPADFDKLQDQKLPKSTKWEIADVSFGKSDMDDIDYL